MIRALLVDDERLARAELRSLLCAHPTITIVGEAADAPSAATIARTELPDVIFLDIELGATNAFDVLGQIPCTCRVVFVTAHDEYAVRAFEVDGVDYLLKPVQPKRLAEAVARLEAAHGTKPQLDPDDRLMLPVDKFYKLVKVRAIVWILAAGDYSEVHLADGAKLLVLKSLREWEERLPDKQFIRIHRSAIVNVDAIEKVEEWFNSSFRIHLRGVPEPLVSSRRHSAALRSRFSG